MSPICAVVRPHPQTAAEHRDWTWGGVAVIVGVCLMVAAVGEVLSPDAGRLWSPDPSTPAWSPPGWVFGLLGSALYLVLAAAGSLVWLARDQDDVCCPLTAFAVLLVAGVAWPVVFFGFGSPLLGLIDLVVLWLTTAVTAAHFFCVSRLAGGLMVPFLAWVSYLTALNAVAVFRFS